MRSKYKAQTQADAFYDEKREDEEGVNFSRDILASRYQIQLKNKLKNDIFANHQRVAQRNKLKKIEEDKRLELKRPIKKIIYLNKEVIEVQKAEIECHSDELIP